MLPNEKRIHEALVMQWHVTERCNWRCKHCYQDDYNTPELNFKDLLKVIDQFKDLLEQYRRDIDSADMIGRINVSGGEPFIREDFLDLLDVFSKEKDYYRFSILTNGSYIDRPMARRLKSLGVFSVQVSIEGVKDTNDHVRGPGASEKTAIALENMRLEGVRSSISFTAHRENYKEFPEVARIGRKLKAGRVWSDRIIPYGSGLELLDQLLSPEETKEYFELMYSARNEAARTFQRTDVSMARALQFLVGGGTPYKCEAGNRLVTIMPNGDLYPCRRMPIYSGNLMETPLVELYNNNELFIALRDRTRLNGICGKCKFGDKCRGGLRCLAYAITGDTFQPDPGCWIAADLKKQATDASGDP